MEEEKGLSFMDIFRTIASEKWLAVIVAAAITLVGVLGINFIYNPHVSEYVVKFNLNLPNFNNYSYYQYGDGTRLYFVSMVTPEKIKEVKEKDADAFKKINPDKTELEISVESYGVAGESTSEQNSDKRFVLKARVSDFPDEKTAREFLKSVAEIPVNYLKESKADTGHYLEFAASAVDYEMQISYIKNQVEFLRGVYRSLINEYGYSFSVPGSGRTLQYYLLQLDDYISNGSNSNNKLDNLLTEARKNAYIKNLDFKADGGKYDLDLREYQRNLDSAQETLQRLLQVAVTDSGSASVIKAQSDLVEDYKKRIEDINNYKVNGTTDAAYEQKVNAAMQEIEAFTETYKNVIAEVYEKAAFAAFYDATIVDTDGGMGTVTSCVLSLAAGVIIALIAAYIAGAAKNRKKKAAAQGAPSEPEGADEKTE